MIKKPEKLAFSFLSTILTIFLCALVFLGTAVYGSSQIQQENTLLERLVFLASTGQFRYCPSASPHDDVPDDEALQLCLDEGGIVALEPPPQGYTHTQQESGYRGYIINKGLVINQPNTTITSAVPPRKAVLVAGQSLNDRMIQRAPDRLVNGTKLYYLIVDGNKYNRTASNCRGFPRPNNISLGGDDLEVSYVESLRALCGGALEVHCSNGCLIANNFVGDNGFGGLNRSDYLHGPEPWADGITLGLCHAEPPRRAWIHSNTVEDSTDVGIVIGGGRNCLVEKNVIRQTKSHAYTGLGILNFEYEGKGDHEGGIYRNNIIESADGKLDFGISVGIHSWFPYLLTQAGHIYANRVRGATVNLAVDGYKDGTIGYDETGGLKPNILENPSNMPMVINKCRNFYANYTVAHVRKVCLPEGAVPISFDSGSSCRDLSFCGIARQIREDCPSKAAWQQQCLESLEGLKGSRHKKSRENRQKGPR